MRRALPVLPALFAAVSAAGLAWASTALAYISPTDAETPPGTGTCTINGVDAAVTSLQVAIGGDAHAEVAADGSLVYVYSVVAYCGVNANGNNEYVMTHVTVPLRYAIDDAAGTLTVFDKTVPQAFTGETFDGLTGAASLTSGFGPLPAVVYGADDATEKRTVVTYHKKITGAKTDADRALYFNQLQAALI